jgi:hypothetical protein
MLMFQDPTITEQNMRIDILESSVLTKPEELIVDKAVLNRIRRRDPPPRELT